MAKLSKRAQQALALLRNGGSVVHRLERNAHTGREQFVTRFCADRTSRIVPGLGFKTRCEIEDAGFSLVPFYGTSVSTYYQLRD